MMTWFANPWGLSALLALPAIYWLHRHVIDARRREVSNLALWSDREHVRSEGRARRRVTDWLVLTLELTAALALALVVAGFEPQPGRAVHPRIALVIDASASMSAGTAGRRPIDLARARLAAAAREQPELRVSLVLAAAEPTLLGDVDLTPARADELLAQFEPHAASCRLTPALDLARSLDLAAESILVFSDDAALSHPRLMRVGDAVPNVAIVRASWEPHEAPFIVVRRFGPGATAIDVRVQLDGGEPSIQHIVLDGDGQAPLALRVAETVQRVDVALPVDSMPLDDRATLLRPPARDVLVDASGTSPALQAAVRHAVASIPALRAAATPKVDLRITEMARLPDSSTNLLFLTHGVGKSLPALAPQADPFSQLMAAFEPRGLVWYAWPVQPPAGAQILLRSEDQALIWRDAAAISLNIDLARSNFLGHAAFPIFMDAVVQTVDRARGGLPRSSFALGETLNFLPNARWTGPVRVQTPSGEITTFAAGSEIDLGALREPGVYELRAEEHVERWAVHLSSAAESNLLGRKPSSVPPPLSLRPVKTAERSPLWLAVLLVAALACACLAFTRLDRRATSQ